MIPPRKQWCIQIDVTNACTRACSNCTRMTAHAREPFFMDRACFERACDALATFPTESDPDPFGRRKVVGIIGGEPLLHPEFGVLVTIMRRFLPNAAFRGLWTGVNWPLHRHADDVHRLLGGWSTSVSPGESGGYLNWNMHLPACIHQPVLVAIQDVVHDDARMWELINRCPLQEQWSATITPKGFFFCEVAGAMDMVFDGPGGLPVTPGCWRHDLAEYRGQIEQWCPRCGVCLPLTGRRDDEQQDDVSESNARTLRHLGSPRVLEGAIVPFSAERWEPPRDWEPLRYKRNAS